ncbi:MAG: hypothetical protein V1792_03850 [Pseudomonadota bacterium]
MRLETLLAIALVVAVNLVPDFTHTSLFSLAFAVQAKARGEQESSRAPGWVSKAWQKFQDSRREWHDVFWNPRLSDNVALAAASAPLTGGLAGATVGLIPAVIPGLGTMTVPTGAAFGLLVGTVFSAGMSIYWAEGRLATAQSWSEAGRAVASGGITFASLTVPQEPIKRALQSTIVKATSWVWTTAEKAGLFSQGPGPNSGVPTGREGKEKLKQWQIEQRDATVRAQEEARKQKQQWCSDLLQTMVNDIERAQEHYQATIDATKQGDIALCELAQSELTECQGRLRKSMETLQWECSGFSHEKYTTEYRDKLATALNKVLYLQVECPKASSRPPGREAPVNTDPLVPPDHVYPWEQGR